MATILAFLSSKVGIYLSWFAYSIIGTALVVQTIKVLKSPDPKLPPIVVDTVGLWDVYEGIVATDEEGKEVMFHIKVLSDEFNWAYKMTDYVEFQERKVDIREHLATAGMQYRLKDVEDIICVGTASYEGDDQSREEDRAKSRSEQLRIWVKETLAASIDLHTLNLGQNKSCKNCKSTTDSAYQRRIILVGVTNKEEGVDIKSALKRTLIQYKELPISLEQYSKFIFNGEDI